MTHKLTHNGSSRGSAPAKGDEPFSRHRSLASLILFRLHIPSRLHIVGLRVALVHMIGFEDIARVHMAPVHNVRAAPTRMVVGMVATVPVRR